MISNVLQTLLTINTPPPKNNKLIIMATNEQLLQMLHEHDQQVGRLIKDAGEGFLRRVRGESGKRREGH